MTTSTPVPRSPHWYAQRAGLSVAALLLFAVLFGTVLTAGAQAAVGYNAQEVAFVNLLNDFRTANGLPRLLVSDMISEACDRHNSDMGKYAFFGHYSLRSDWFKASASPWDRMALSGYSFNTNKGENIAAGQSTATQVFAAWKASAGHNANMLNSTFKVLGVSLVAVAGSPYTYYWTTDFGGYVDPTAHTVTQPLSPVTIRYQQNDSHFIYSGTWATFSTASASAGSYKRASANGSSVTVRFTGTYLAWIATRGTTLGKAYVSLDGGPAVSINLAASVVAYQQKVWNTGTLTSGTHTVKIWRNPSNIVGKYISADAFDVQGRLN